MSDKPLQVQRSVTVNYDNGDRFCTLTDLAENNEIRLEIFDKKDKTGNQKRITSIRTKRSSILKMFVALWPEEVAYQFKESEDG